MNKTFLFSGFNRDKLSSSNALPMKDFVEVKFPNVIAHEQKTWYLTNKFGIQFATELPAAEYMDQYGNRVWMNAHQQIYED